MSSTQRLGFGKKIRLDWLILALRLRQAGANFEAAREPLSVLVGETNQGQVAIKKALSNVRQVVFAPAEKNQAFATAGIEMVRAHGDSVALEVAWGLSLVSYSFFALSAETTGRLLRLNESFTAAELVRRLREKTGDRDFVSRVGRYNLSSILDWGVLALPAGAKRYKRGKLQGVRHPDVAAWLLEAALRTSGKTTLPLQQLWANSVLFPFELPMCPGSTVAKLNPRLTITRLGLNEELVELHDRG